MSACRGLGLYLRPPLLGFQSFPAQLPPQLGFLLPLFIPCFDLGLAFCRVFLHRGFAPRVPSNTGHQYIGDDVDRYANIETM